MAATKEDNTKLNFSFAGCGFLGIYHFGVVACLRRYVPHLLNKVSGASAGALASCCIVADVPVSDAAAMWLNGCVMTRDKVIGALSPSSDLAGYVRYQLECCVPQDAHLLVNGKVNISITRVRDMKNVVISHFDSRAEFIDALICAITIPFFVGLVPPLFRGERYIDGGFSNNVLIRDEHTVTVSPFSGEADICPRDGSTLSPWTFMAFNNTSMELSMKNIIRLSYAFMPPRPETLAQICHQGYEDTLRFLVSRDLVGCQACLLSPFDQAMIGGGHLDDTAAEEDQYLAQICRECEAIREFSEGQSLPDSVLKPFRDAIDSDMRSFGARLRQYKIMKLMTVATMPLALSYDFMYATGRKLAQVPEILGPHLPISKIISPHLTALQALQEALIPLP